MLLPEDQPEQVRREFLVAAREASPLIAGVSSFRRGEHALHSVRFRVLRTLRRQGVGSRLLQAVVAEARASGSALVLAPSDPESEPDAGPFLRAHGFTHLGRLVTVEAGIEAMLEHLLALGDRLRAGGKVPAQARIVPLSEAPWDQVFRLYAEHIIHNPELACIPIRNPAVKETMSVSRVLMVAERVEGMLLATLEGPVAVVHARAVAPAYRFGFANALLMAAAIENGRSMGARQVRFDVPGDNRDTLKLAQRFHAKTLKTRDRFVLRLVPDSGPGVPMR